MAQDPRPRVAVQWWARAIVIAAAALCVPGALADDEPSVEDEGSVFLPTDRARERQLDRARRLIADGQWTDAALLLDELLAAERDAFVHGGGVTGTRRSIRTEAAQFVRQLPPTGRDAYDTLFRARAARALADAIAADDAEAIGAVARRWFETPSGREAAILTAVTALESNQPLAASSWLERLATVPEARRFEPTLSLLRAAAWELAGEPSTAAALIRAARGTTRIRGREVRLSAAGAEGLQGWLAGRKSTDPLAREWRQPRGDPARNAVSEASGPLLVPRYRVPLTSHPEEGRLLGQRRRALAAGGNLVMPGGIPIAVAGTIVVHTSLGVLAIDFETGKRSWLQSAFPAPTGEAAARNGGPSALERIFDDATSGGLASDGRFVFAVESHPDALTPVAGNEFEARGGNASGWRGGNVLSAYDLRDRGAVRWRRPQRGPAAAWHLGPPLVVGEKLFVLVDDHEQVRLEVLDAATGAVEWAQPLADRDSEQVVTTAEGFARRRAGLTPAFAEGVLVCPLGEGAIVAVDLATRSLLWAHSYRRTGERPARGAFGDAGAAQESAETGAGDACPIIAGGRVLLAPADAEGILCLGLRDGAAVWPEQPRRQVHIAGVSEGRVICLSRTGVEAVDAATGRRLWQRPYPPNTHPSGRGILTTERLLLPLDSAEVVEISLADGAELERRPARGRVAPGNLVAYRGEIISRGIESLDVFHQAGALEDRIETARRKSTDEPWASYWRAHLDIERGDMADGLARLRSAAAGRAPPQALADALLHGMRRDFRGAVATWQAWQDAADPAAAAPQVMRLAVDNFLRLGDTNSAWAACRQLLNASPAAAPPAKDSSDPVLEVDADCWLRGRIAELAGRAEEPLRQDIATAVAGAVAAARTDPDPSSRLRRLQSLVARLGMLPAGTGASAALAAEIDRRLATTGDVPRPLLLRRQLLTIDGQATLGGTEEPQPERHPWPFGRVVVERGRTEVDPAPDLTRGPLISIPLATAGRQPALTATYDTQQRRLIIADAHGRRLVDPLPVDTGRAAAAMPWHEQAVAVEPSLVGSLLFVRTTSSVTAFDLAAGPATPRMLWRHAWQPAAGAAAAFVRLAGPGGPVARDRGIPVGRRITEPDDLSARASAAGAPARAGGVLACGPRSVSMLDPATGRVLWEREGVPRAADWVGDDEFLCGCTPDGRGSVVLSARDGRLLHVTDVPHRRHRLASSGRRLIALVPLDEAPVATRVRIDVVDPVDRESRPLGECAGESLATLVGDGRLAVLEPGGRLTVFDLTDGEKVLSTVLPDAPPRCDYLYAQSWEDRYLVFAGVGSPGIDDDGHGTPALQGFAASDEASAPLSGTIWAVDRQTGSLLWPTPATVERQCLQPHVPNAVPVLVFCRRMRPGAGHDQPHVSLLCLDKRTGRAVLDDERIAAQPQFAFRCDVVGDPASASVTIGAGGGIARPLVLRFTSDPIPPGPAFRARSRPPEPGRGLHGLGESAQEIRSRLSSPDE